MVARVLFPWPTHPHIHHPRPYGSPGLLPAFPT